MNQQRPQPELEPAVFVIDGPVERARIPELCAELRAFCEGHPRGEVVCDVERIDAPDAADVDALARLQLTARRVDRRIRFRRAGRELIELLELAGLAEVLPCLEVLGVEVVGEAPQRKEVLRVEEERDPADHAAGELEHLERPGLEAS